MKQKLSTLRYLLLAAIIVTALAFGAKQAPADAECRECEEPEPTACLQKPDPDAFCEELCWAHDCILGLCHQKDECMCAMK